MTQRVALCIGVPEPGWTFPTFRRLPLVADGARELADAAAACAFEAVCRTNPRDTGFPSIWGDLTRAVETVRSGGRLFLTFAGHGVRREEARRESTSWILSGQNQQLVSSDLAHQLRQCPAAASIVCVSDCCYGVGILEALTTGAAPHIPASIVLISPADAGMRTAPGFSTVFAAIMTSPQRDWEETRRIADSAWRTASNSHTGRVCMRRYGDPASMPSPADFWSAT